MSGLMPLMTGAPGMIAICVYPLARGVGWKASPCEIAGKLSVATVGRHW